MYLTYLKIYGIPWALMVYPFFKVYNVSQHGFKYEFQVTTLLLDFAIWTGAAILYSFLMYYWYYLRVNKRKKK